VRRVRWSSCGFARGRSRSRADNDALYPRSRYSACRVYGDRASTGYVCSRGWHTYCAPCSPHIYRHPCDPHTYCVPRSSPVCRCHHNTTSAHSPAADRPLQRRRPRETRVVERSVDAGADSIQTGGADRARNARAVSTTSAAANHCSGTTDASDGSYHPLRPDRSRGTHAPRNVDAPIGGYDAQGAVHPQTYGAGTGVTSDTDTYLHPHDDTPFPDAAGGRDVNADSGTHGGRPDRDRHHDEYTRRTDCDRHEYARWADHDHHDDDHARGADRDRLDHARWPHGDRDHDARRPDRNRHDDEHAGWPHEDRDGIDHVRWPNAAYNEHAGSPTHDRDGDHDARWANADRLNNAYTAETDSTRHHHRHHRRHAAAVSPREHS